MIRRFLACAAIACSAAPAFGHALLNHADPGAGAALRSSPSKIVLVFSEKLKAAGSGVAVTDSTGRSVEAGTATVAGDSMLAPLRPLPAGTYRVVWHALSLDNHRTQGAYRFVVKP
jgi:hypothetical protein